MEFVVRAVRSACDLVFGSTRGAVGLRHGSGAVLTVGSPSGGPVRFASVSEAESFRERFLDEPSAWCPVPVETAHQAA
jgi:hypothetical protein